MIWGICSVPGTSWTTILAATLQNMHSCTHCRFGNSGSARSNCQGRSVPGAKQALGPKPMPHPLSGPVPLFLSSWPSREEMPAASHFSVLKIPAGLGSHSATLHFHHTNRLPSPQSQTQGLAGSCRQHQSHHFPGVKGAGQASIESRDLCHYLGATP